MTLTFKVVYTPTAQKDLDYWKTNNQAIFLRIKRIHEAVAMNPLTGIGKPERLKHQLAGKMSRRITEEHRYVYAVASDCVVVFSCRFHY